MTRNRLKTVTNHSTSALTQYFYDNRRNISYIIPLKATASIILTTWPIKITQISDTLGNKIQYTYDVEGNKTRGGDLRSSNNLKKQLDFTYDTYNRLEKDHQPRYDLIRNILMTARVTAHRCP